MKVNNDKLIFTVIVILFFDVITSFYLLFFESMYVGNVFGSYAWFIFVTCLGQSLGIF